MNQAHGPLSGWLTTKKRGRDDSQIAVDRQRAMTVRKKEKNKKNDVNAINAINAHIKKSKKSRKQVLDQDDDSDDDYDSDDSIHEFVVDDTTTNTNNDVDVDADADTDTSSDTFLLSYKSRKSQPSKVLRLASEASKKKRANPMAMVANARGASMTSKPRVTQDIRDSSLDIASSSEGYVTSPSSGKKKTSRFFPKKVTPYDTSDDDSLQLTSKSRWTKQQQEQRQQQQQQQQPGSSRNPSKLLGAVTTPPRKKILKNPTRMTLASLEDTPEQVSKQKTKKNKKNMFATFQHPSIYDSATDDDERIALQAALKASLRETKTKKKGKSKNRQHPIPKAAAKNDEDENEDEPLISEELLQDSSEEEEEPEDSNDVYNEEQKVATSILKTAQALSAKVLNSMLEWSQQNDTATGMIVDGALSLGNIQESSSHKWISQEVMKEACPGVTLSNYQLIGVNWLALLHGMDCQIEGKNTPVNGVLADEMGLGKTVQTIAFLAWLKHQQPKQNKYPHLIVVPVSVLPNWLREFTIFCPEMKVVKYHGSQSERENIQEELRPYLPSDNSQEQALDVILVPVTYYQKEKSDDRKFLNKFRFNYLVVDEAHMLKNAQSTRYRMLDRIKTQHRLLLTGTPVQNSPQELLNMLCFIMPLFSKGSENMEDGSDNVGDRMLQHFVDAEMEQNGDEQVAYKKLKQLFAPFVLRRKKEDVIAQLLPPKERFIEYVDLDAKGRAIYDSILDAHVHKNGTKLTAAIGEHLFTNLRKAAHHPLLLRVRHNTASEMEHLSTYFHKYGAFQGEGSTKARVAEEVSKYNDFQIHLTALELIEENPHRENDLQRYILDEDALFSSAKFVRLRTLLPKLMQEGHRVLIFSGWTSCLDLLGCLMEHLGLKYLRMDGSCASDVRQEMIDEFNQNDSINVFLLSTRACGLGINLTSADTCIMHDLDFNPFNDLQAEDRCHRIGQTRKVTIYKMVAKDTVDADIYEMQERKAKMNAAIMESNDSKKERKVMLQAVVNRFLKSPKSPKKPKKEICVL